MSNRLLSWLLGGAVVGGLFVLMLLLYLGVTSSVSELGGSSIECARSDQCEALPVMKLFAEPQNTLSNLVYLLAGLTIGVRALRPGFGPSRVAPLMVGASFVFLAACSGWYHATLNGLADVGHLPDCATTLGKLSQKLDIVGVYLSLFALIGFGIDRLARQVVPTDAPRVLAMIVGPALALAAWLVAGPVGGFDGWMATGLVVWLTVGVTAIPIVLVARGGVAARAAWAWWGGAMAVWVVMSALMRMALPFDSVFVFVVLVGMLVPLVGLNLLLPPADGTTVRWSLGEVLLTLGVFTIGIAARLLDGHAGGQPKALCLPDSPLQAHATWHVMSGLSLLLAHDLIEKAAAGRLGTAGSALLPPEGSLVRWLAAPGSVAGRTPGALVVQVLIALAALMFLAVMLWVWSGWTLASLVPLAASAYLLWAGYRDPSARHVPTR